MTETSDPAEGIARSRNAYFKSDQIVVGLRYRKLVVDELTSMGADPSEIDQDELLGLGLYGINSSAVVARLADTTPGAEWVAQQRAQARSDGYDATPLDLVIRRLRWTFGDQHNGWFPTIGKNRIVGRVTGSYVIDGGGQGSPSDVLDGSGQAQVQYVIDGGGQATSSRVSVSLVAPRKAEPGRGVRVGVVDTRIAANPWLAGGWTTAASDILPANPAKGLPDAAGHATFVSGLVLRQAPGAVLDLRSGLGDDGTQDSWATAKAIASLAGSGVQVVNLSFGCFTDDGQPPLVLQAALASLGPDTVVVAAVGNNAAAASAGEPLWPAAFEGVIAVGAVDDTDSPASFTPDVPWLDAWARGVDVVSTYLRSPLDNPDDLSFARWSGTSFAAAVVSGAIAALVQPGNRTAKQAWDELSGKSATVRGLPLVALNVIEDWP